MHSPRLAILFALSASASVASAQTSTCMNMGPDMVHCNSTDGSVTDCMRMGETMATCITMNSGAAPTYNDDGGAALGRGLVDMVRGMNERSFRSKVGKMLASGDCAGAVKYAFDKGRIEFGTSLQQACNRQASQLSSGDTVENRINQMAVRARTPIEIDSDLSLTQVQARGKQLQFIFVSSTGEPNLDDRRSALINDACGTDDMLPLFRGGASIRARFFNSDNEEIGAVLVDASDCGIR